MTIPALLKNIRATSGNLITVFKIIIFKKKPANGGNPAAISNKKNKRYLPPHLLAIIWWAPLGPNPLLKRTLIIDPKISVYNIK